MRLAIALAVSEELCTVVEAGQRLDVPFADFFPRPRANRVVPGNLVAMEEVAGTAQVVWRWFDAVVVAAQPSSVTLWEQFHGVVTASVRDTSRQYVVGSRIYASSGLPGADWWAVGPVVARAEEAEVDAHEAHQFLVAHDLIS